MVINKKIGREVIIISNELDYLKEVKASKIPFLLVLHENEMDSYGNDISFAPYIYLIPDYLAINNETIDNLIEDDYLRLVISRFRDIPLVIDNNQKLYIRELTIDDVDSLINLYKNEKYIEPFFDNKNDAETCLKKYIKDVYGFFGFGIWGVFSNSELYGIKNEFMGITGFSRRDEGIELCYALIEKYRSKNLAYEAVNLAIDYADRNIEYDKIIINVDKSNINSIKLAEKIKKGRTKIELNIRENKTNLDILALGVII